MTASTKITLFAMSMAVIVVALVTGAVLFFFRSTPQAIVIPASQLPSADTEAKVAQAKADLAAVGVKPRNGAPAPTSPFSDVRWKGSAPEVMVNGTWYGLVAIDHLPADQVVSFVQKNFGDPWKQRFAANFSDIMEAMNHPITNSVTLQLATLDTHEATTLSDVPMTAANVASTHAQPRGVAAFSGVRWKGDAPEVQVNAKWYGLVAIDDQPAEKIINFAKTTYAGASPSGTPSWQKRFAEDLGEVMSRMGHPLDDAVKLDLRDLTTSDTVTLANVPMTEANRDAILAQVGVRNPGPGAAPIPGFVGGQNIPTSRGMPFAAIRWRDQTPEVFVKGKWYELIAFDDMPTPQFIDAAKRSFGQSQWERRFPEDLANVLSDLGKPTDAVDLQLRTLDTKDVITMTSVPMNEMNRTLNMFGVINNIADVQKGTLTFFSAVQWKDDIAQVQINGNETWYELLAIDDKPAASVFDSAKQRYGDDWKKQIEANSVALMQPLPNGYGAWLKLHTLDTDETVSILKLVFPPVDISHLRQH